MAVSKTSLRTLRWERDRAADLAAGPPARDVVGSARLGRKTKRLVPELVRGEVAVIDHEDLDRVSAEDLVAAGAGGVVNVARSSTGRYPNQGPAILADAGVVLLDVPGAPLFEVLEDGQRIVIRGEEVLRAGVVLARGVVHDSARVAAAQEEGRERIGEALEAFATNTLAHMREEGDLLAGRIELPGLRTRFRDRPALVVVRGVDHQKDLRTLRPYVRDERPVLVAVDGAADAILNEGFTPDMIVGDMDSATDRALRCGAELVVHAYPDGRAPGRDRLETLGLEHAVVPAPATSEDVAMLIAAERGARLIVAVGSHFNLVEFLDKNRSGMSSTFLTRLRIGDILVDAKGVSRLYRPSPGARPLAVVTLSALATLVLVVALSPGLRSFVELLWLKLQVLLGLG